MDRDFIFFFVGLLLGYAVGTFILVLVTRAERKHDK